ncbi:hypothetical protein FPHYL_7096 [Fusarium phyllophilum]|uniref:F-box domain-containing protein n=1 Tax=Fusarium phyllophilum TaxID=47803 RepID=A0A8H5JQ63_9HYPO|nr:hypothetical protein FPHYL_7096 [Fusarium phyllophilum]
MPSITAVTIFIFGLSAFNHGVSNLISPRKALAAKQLQDSALPALNGFSVAIIGIGIYYMLAAYQENRGFFALTLARFISARIFWLQGPAWRVIATWEAFSAALTAVALAYEGYHRIPQWKFIHVQQFKSALPGPRQFSVMKLQDIPLELRQAIFELVLKAPVAPSSPSESQNGRDQLLYCLRDMRYGWCPRGVWQQQPRNKSLSLLLVSKQFCAEVQDIFRRLPNNYHVDIMFVKNYGFWPTWDIAKRPTSRYIDKITSTIRIFEPTDDLDDRFKDSLRFAGGDGGPESAAWALYELLVSLIQHGPGYLGLKDNQRFIVNEIEVNVVSPTDGAAHTRLACRDNENPWWLRWSGIEYGNEPVPEKRLANYMTSFLDIVFNVESDTMPYCQELYDHITESITFQLNGQEWEKRRIDEYLEKCHPSTWPQDYRDGWCRKTLKTRQRIRRIRRSREKTRKGLELNDKQPK